MTNLARIRAQRGQSLRELAETIGCSFVTVWTWETGECKPRALYAERLEERLGIPADVLVSDDPELLQREEAASA